MVNSNNFALIDRYPRSAEDDSSRPSRKEGRGKKVSRDHTFPDYGAHILAEPTLGGADPEDEGNELEIDRAPIAQFLDSIPE